MMRALGLAMMLALSGCEALVAGAAGGALGGAIAGLWGADGTRVTVECPSTVNN